MNIASFAHSWAHFALSELPGLFHFPCDTHTHTETLKHLRSQSFHPQGINKTSGCLTGQALIQDGNAYSLEYRRPVETETPSPMPSPVFSFTRSLFFGSLPISAGHQ